ncbi:MAG: efflux RND transporter periplasmic adaptor subunit, partial [Pseudomonadota bacterium]
ETDIARIKLRQAARVTLDAYPDTTFNGQVIEIAFDAKTVNNVTTYTVDVLPQKPPAFLRSGMTANVNFLLVSRQAVLLVPAAAIKVRQGESYLMVPGEKDVPVERVVTIGVSDGRQAEVAGRSLLAQQRAVR